MDRCFAMTLNRITKFGVLMLGVAFCGYTAPAKAGFEFSAPSAAPAAPQPAPEDALDAPMPIVPMEDVTAMPLDTPATDAGTTAAKKPDVDHVLKLPVSYQTPKAAPSEPVYIRRQRGIVMKAPKNQPMDTEALLKATENGEMVTLEGSPRPNLAPQPVDDGKLVINPYPLDSEKGASHGGGMGSLATEQAMMEQGGNLRAVAVPGKTAPGMIARARISSRYDNSSQYMDRTPVQDDAAVFGLASSMTPIPGGEGEPLTQIAAVPLPPPAPVKAAAPAPRPPVVEEKVSAMPRPAVPEGHLQPAPAAQPDVAANNGFTEAVGFGRDLPLALALSQIVPPEYSYAFGSNVNVGSTVSWQGGKPWNEVLNDMLATQGMRAVISGSQITILNAGQSA